VLAQQPKHLAEPPSFQSASRGRGQNETARRLRRPTAFFGLRSKLVTQGLCALQLGCHFQPTLGETFQHGFKFGVCRPFSQLLTAQGALMALGHLRFQREDRGPSTWHFKISFFEGGHISNASSSIIPIPITSTASATGS
jgi:hypothetical protein